VKERIEPIADPAVRVRVLQRIPAYAAVVEGCREAGLPVD
jgi:hypothetical protein